ncbi:MAG: hypothetical protein AMJ69_06940 [Gammaproteobacteria bacterium SG8_47]|nr:MAG: hypothetical protein AMJ69_06940 [Gammaproteobacteria bacterium SG8_47]
MFRWFGQKADKRIKDSVFGEVRRRRDGLWEAQATLPGEVMPIDVLIPSGGKAPDEAYAELFRSLPRRFESASEAVDEGLGVLYIELLSEEEAGFWFGWTASHDDTLYFVRTSPAGVIVEVSGD